MRLPSLALVFLAFSVGVVSAQEQEYLIEGRDRRHGTFNGRLVIKPGDDGLVVTRTTHYLTRGAEVLTGPASRSGSMVRARFALQSGMVGRLDGRQDKPIRLWVDHWLGDQDIETYSKQGARFRSKGAGVRVSAHKRNRLPVAERRPKLVESTHTYSRFPGRAFIKGQGDKHEVDVNDVGQGGLGDCYFMAGLAAVAYTDPHRIRAMIREHPNGSFSVTVYRHNDQWEETNPDANGFYRPTIKAVRITVDDSFPAGADGKRPVYAWYGDAQGEGADRLVELWPMILEKAWAQHRGSYAGIEGGWASTPMSFFSAKPVWDGNPRELSDEELLRRFKYAVRMHYPVTLGVPSPGGDHALNVHDDHYYTFIGLDDQDRVRLYNPWGEDHPTRTLTIKEIKTIFDGMHVGRF